MSGISAYLEKGGSKPAFIPSYKSRGAKTSRHSEKSSDQPSDHHGVSFGGSYIKHISESDKPMRRNRDSNYSRGGHHRGNQRDFRGRDNKKDYRDFGSYKREDEFGSKTLEEKDDKLKAEEEALALKLAEQDDSLQAIGSEFFIPVEQEYDMFLKKLINWKHDSHSISQKFKDGEQLKQFREYDEEAAQQTKDLMLHIFKSNSQHQGPKSVCATTDRELTSAFKNSVSEIQEDVARGRNKNYGLLDKTILHYEDIMYSLWKAPLITDRKSEKETETTLEDDNFEKFHEEFERENNEKKDLGSFSQFVDELFEKCTELYKIAEKTPLYDVSKDDQMQEAIQSVIDTSKKSVFRNTDRPYNAGHLFFAISDLLGRKDEKEYASDRRVEKSQNTPKRSRDEYESDEENQEEDRQVKATTTFELIGDRFRLLPEIHRYENYLKRSMGVTGLDYTGKTSLNNRKKQIRLDSSVALRHEWMDKEPKEIAKMATPHTHLSRMVSSLSEKCKQVVDSLLY